MKSVSIQNVFQSLTQAIPTTSMKARISTATKLTNFVLDAKAPCATPSEEQKIWGIQHGRWHKTHQY